MSGSVTVLEVAGAAGLTVYAVAMWVAVGVLAYALRGPLPPWLPRVAAGVITAGVVGQLGHVQEHVAQAAYWVLHPEEPAWMTPWGDGLARGFHALAGGQHALGMELLHLTGNVVFLAGLVGVALVARHAAAFRARRWARMGVWMQGLHGLEHLVLTVSVALGGPAVGLSTWFGTIEPGPALWTYRIWWHFLANVAGSIVLTVALCLLWAERDRVAGSWSGARRVTPQRAPVHSNAGESQ
ncbi:hypothetical protein B0I33_111192 [Prauserella shujinwangii]|uniref:Uncharacterized protein n=1 Tax=Prauserella shujinwangii TaxID=1453103 RepID=A0A2T0LNA6_9PSEU|nr:DUF6008 family protein [Prauserella shujinwangii]PRX44678.1 hypothetical protein B0I33_111192 [Prauserella shujinwangii]